MFLVMLSVGAVSAVDDVNSTDNVFVDGTNDIYKMSMMMLNRQVMIMRL